MSYSVLISKKAAKSIEGIIDPFYEKIKSGILKLSIEPRSQGYIKLKGRNAFRIRVSHYRFILKLLMNLK